MCFKSRCGQVTETPPQQQQQQHTDVQTVALELCVAGETVQQRTVEQVIELRGEEPRKEPVQVQQRSDEPPADARLDQAPLNVTRAGESSSRKEHRTSCETRIGASKVRKKGSTKILTSQSTVAAPNGRVTRVSGLTSLCPTLVSGMVSLCQCVWWRYWICVRMSAQETFVRFLWQT